MRTRVFFNDFELTDGFLAVDLERPFPGHTLTTRDVPGRDGTVVTSSVLMPIEIGLTLVCTIPESTDRRRAIHEVLRVLDSSEGKLRFSDEEGYYLARPSEEGERTGFFRAEGIRLNFLIHDPVRWGRVRTATIPSGGSVTIGVLGDRPASPIITASSAVGSNGVWGVTDQGGDHVFVAATSSASVTIDCAKHVSSRAGMTVVPTLDSDYLSLVPGSHTLVMTGTGEAKVTWQERWL